MSEEKPHYRTDLAWIHHAGFSEFARVASAGVLASLKAHDIREGLIADIGCGSGVLARALTDAGYDVLGIDASPAMIELARVTAPAAHSKSHPSTKPRSRPAQPSPPSAKC